MISLLSLMILVCLIPVPEENNDQLIISSRRFINPATPISDYYPDTPEQSETVIDLSEACDDDCAEAISRAVSELRCVASHCQSSATDTEPTN